MRLKMLAVCLGEGVPPRLEDILEKLLEDLAQGRERNWESLQSAGLGGFLWGLVQRSFGYQATSASLRDFAIALYQSCYALGLGEKAPLGQRSPLSFRFPPIFVS